MTLIERCGLKFKKVVRLFWIFIWKHNSTVSHLYKSQFKSNTPYSWSNVRLLRKKSNKSLAFQFGAKNNLNLNIILFFIITTLFLIIKSQNSKLLLQFPINCMPHLGWYDFPFIFSLNLWRNKNFAYFQIVTFMLQLCQYTIRILEQKIITEL